MVEEEEWMFGNEDALAIPIHVQVCLWCALI